MNLFTPNTDSITNYYEKGKFILAWRISLLLGIGFILLSISLINSNVEKAIIYALSTIIITSLIAIVYLGITKKSRPVYFFIAFLGSFIILYTTTKFTYLLHIGDFLWFTVIVVFAFLGLGKKWGIFFLVANIITLINYTFFNINLTNLYTLDYIEKYGLGIEMSFASISIVFIIFQFMKFHEFTYNELYERNKIITKQNDENIALVKEVHHRVKNNLQIIISLLRLQSNELKTNEAIQSLTEATNRILILSLIHEKLYSNKSLSKINLKEYINDLVRDVKYIYTHKNINVDIKIDENINIGLKTIIPLGLLINELLSHSFRHDFVKNKNSFISINLKEKNNNQFELIFFINDKWTKHDTDTNSFGIELIEIMTSQLEGEYQRKENEKGTIYNFILTNIKEE